MFKVYLVDDKDAYTYGAEKWREEKIYMNEKRKECMHNMKKKKKKGTYTRGKHTCFVLIKWVYLVCHINLRRRAKEWERQKLLHKHTHTQLKQQAEEKEKKKKKNKRKMVRDF